jgi:hypothetical protein
LSGAATTLSPGTGNGTPASESSLESVEDESDALFFCATDALVVVGPVLLELREDDDDDDDEDDDASASDRVDESSSISLT